MIFGVKAGVLPPVRRRFLWLAAVCAALAVALGTAGCGEKSEPAIHPPTTAPTVAAPTTTAPPATSPAPTQTPTPTAPKPKTTP